MCLKDSVGVDELAVVLRDCWIALCLPLQGSWSPGKSQVSIFTFSEYFMSLVLKCNCYSVPSLVCYMLVHCFMASWLQRHSGPSSLKLHIGLLRENVLRSCIGDIQRDFQLSACLFHFGCSHRPRSKSSSAVHACNCCHFEQWC